MGVKILASLFLLAAASTSGALTYRLDAAKPAYYFSIGSGAGGALSSGTLAAAAPAQPVPVAEASAAAPARYTRDNAVNEDSVGPATSSFSYSSGLVDAGAPPLAAASGAPNEPLAHSASVNYKTNPLSFDYTNHFGGSSTSGFSHHVSHPLKFTEDDASDAPQYDRFQNLFSRFEHTFTDGGEARAAAESSFGQNDVNSAAVTAGDDEEFNEEEGASGGDFEHYQSQTSRIGDEVAAGPHQIETIETKSYHKKVPAFDVAEFKAESYHHENTHEASHKHGEVHYHQHKHMHKHEHKQEHVHKHHQDHKHSHHQSHKHSHHHGHKHGHKHHHGHKHGHEHGHKHHQEHKHDHHHGHKHGHKHHQVHKHDHHQEHKHGHEHKHDHHQDHKHDHHHGHKHGHKHEHHQEHKHDHHHGHKHGHKHEHKHGHKHGHKHSHKHGHKHGHKHHHTKH